MTLSMVQLSPDPGNLVRFAANQGLNDAADEDLGYTIHAWLAAMFGNLAPKPFRLFWDGRGTKHPKLLGYVSCARDDLVEHANTFAEPFARQVCALESIAVASLPATWTGGKRYGFELLACPVGRKSRDGTEQDVFLQHMQRPGPENLHSRDSVYSKWLGERLSGSAKVETVAIDRFRLIRQLRRGARPTAGGRKNSRLVRPQVLFRGSLTVEDPDQFAKVLKSGVGRHKSFGYGMLLLRPEK